jgi:hypothetical protein
MRRPAASAASKAMRSFGVLRGIRRLDVHPLTFRGTKNAKNRAPARKSATNTANPLWEVLERNLLSMFKQIFGEIPHYNQQGKGNNKPEPKGRHGQPRANDFTLAV